MNFVMYVVGAAMVVYSGMIYPDIKGGIHQVFFAVLLGSGTICLGLGAVIGLLSEIARRPIPSPTVHPVNAPSASPANPKPGAEDELISVYKGHRIIRSGTRYRVGDQEFSGVLAAERHIDALSG
ncbi:hypothetical protein LO749_10265 [Paracoccus denitrificans]|uniref:hypothetical protein n=1 Tax=Paracoccus denitrificans TaxID=266 RepID=UPI001E4BDA22|nr:hypothetical protein [Paracoccus denitrificans]UFS64542.1 hypothetical protein LO749_10265 [Paracoccus denitrificans]